jgi:uncharacterized surface anchored protein
MSESHGIIFGLSEIVRASGRIELLVIDSESESPLAGVEFGLYNSLYDTLLETLTSGLDGKVRSDLLGEGIYNLRELSGLDDYLPIEDTFTQTVNAGMMSTVVIRKVHITPPEPPKPHQNSRWQDIFVHLKENKIDVYSPGIKIGECLSPYVVVSHNGSTRYAGISTNIDLYSVMVYVPKQQYSELEMMVQRVKQIMKKMEPMILPYGNETPSFYDDDFKAHMISVDYKNYKKML